MKINYHAFLKKEDNEIRSFIYKSHRICIHMMHDKIICGDVWNALDTIDDDSVSVCITSPPYYRVRDYGFDHQIGMEDTPFEYIGRLISVFRKLRDKMRDNGTFFLNIGDAYMSQYGASHLMGIPYKLAYHLCNDGWLLIDCLIWYKTNHMPSSVNDRFTNTYEPVFVFSKQKENIYNGYKYKKVIKIPLQPIPYEHTASFPENLVRSLLDRVNVRDGDVVLDPFGGSGTVGVEVKKMRNWIFSLHLPYILIEANHDFVDIARDRIDGHVRVEKVDHSPADWDAIYDMEFVDSFPESVINDERGEIYITDDLLDFKMKLSGITLTPFKKKHRKDALYFFGIDIPSHDSAYHKMQCMYYCSLMNEADYVLRNMIVVSRDNGNEWYPVAMFARHSTKTRYRFNLDAVRVEHRSSDNRDWCDEDFTGVMVNDLTKKEVVKGRITIIMKEIKHFPYIVQVSWEDGSRSLEIAVDPDHGEYMRRSAWFHCPSCDTRLYSRDLLEDQACMECGMELWIGTHIPVIKEHNNFDSAIFTRDKFPLEDVDIMEIDDRSNTDSKFASMDKINWGQSPAARAAVIGDYFSKMRLYDIDQQVVARYLNALREHRGMSKKDVRDQFPPEYEHTVGHWFRDDLSGSIPIPRDVEMLEEIFEARGDPLLSALKQVALKFQTVRSSSKGKNPGDFVECNDKEKIKKWLEKLFI